MAERNPSSSSPFLGPIHDTKDAGLESMALEVGTVQGGQIAALGSNKEDGAGDGSFYWSSCYGWYACLSVGIQ